MCAPILFLRDVDREKTVKQIIICDSCHGNRGQVLYVSNLYDKFIMAMQFFNERRMEIAIEDADH